MSYITTLYSVSHMTTLCEVVKLKRELQRARLEDRVTYQMSRD